MKLLTGAAIASLAMATIATPSLAVAEDAWEYRITPYVWAPTLQLDTSIGGAPSTSSDTALLDILDFAFLSTGEVRKGDWGLIVEFNYLDLSNDFTFAGSAVKGKSDLKGVMGGAALAYRFLTQDGLAIDAFGGLRVWSLETTADFRTLPTVSRKNTFVDPIVGLRASYDISPDWFVSGLAEVGGFGAGSDLQWEVIGRVSYRFNETIATGVGYRHLVLKVDRGGLDIDAVMTGPFIALDFTW
ncbi:MAG: hypothetical protein AAF409_03630 [Pseudomonadota bacterium]